MAGDAGSLVVSLGLNAAEYILGLTRAEYQAKQAMKGIEKAVNDARHTIGQFAAGIGLISGGLLTFHGLVSAFEAIKEESIKSEQSILQLNAALKATQGTVGLTSDELEGLAKSIEHATTFDVDDIRNAETALLRFRDVTGDVYKDALQQVPNLAVVLGTSLPEAAQKLGRALEGGARGLRVLRAAGVFLDDTQLQLIQHNDELGNTTYKYKLVLDELRKSTEGAAQAASEGLGGANLKLTRSFHELEKAAGRKIFDDNLEGVNSFIHLLDRMGEHINKTKLSFSEFAEFGGPIKIAVREAAAAFRGFKEASPESYWDKLSEQINKTKISVEQLLEPFGLLKIAATQLERLGGTVAAAYRGDRGTASGKIRGLPPPEEVDPAKVAATAAQAQKEIEKAESDGRLRRFEAQKAFAEKSGQYYATTLMESRGNLALEASAQEFYYSRGLTSAEKYYDGLRDAARKEQDDVAQVIRLRGQAEEDIINSGLSLIKDREAAVARLNALDAEGLQSRIALRDKLQKYDQAEFLANQRLKDEFSELDAKVKELAGDLAGAASIRFKIQTRDVRARAETEDPSGRTAAAIDFIGAQEQRQIELNKAVQEYSNLLARLGVDQDRIAIAQQTGSLTQLEAINKQAELAEHYITVLTRQLEVQRLIAETDPDPFKRASALVHIEELSVAIEKLSVTAEAMQTKFRDIFSGAVSDALTDAITQTKSWSDAFKDAEKAIVRSITNIASQNIAEGLFGKTGALGGIPKFFASLFGGKKPGDAIGSLLGAGKEGEGAAGAASLTALDTAAATAAASLTPLSVSSDLLAVSTDLTSVSMDTAAVSLVALTAAADAAAISLAATAASGVGKAAGDIAGDIPWEDLLSKVDASGFAMASGGFPPVGRPSLVGERGPELFVPRVAGMIIPNDAMRKMGSSFNLNVNVLPGASRASADQAAAAMGLEVRRAMARNV